MVYLRFEGLFDCEIRSMTIEIAMFILRFSCFKSPLKR